MPAKLLLPLRYLQPSFPVARFSTMKPVKTSRVLPVFSRVFPHKLKYQSFGSLNLASNGNNSKQQELKNQFSSNAIRKLSSRSGGEVRASRSLIDDEAELSDWVSGLSSKKTRLYSDSEKDDDESGSVGFGKGRGSGREERGGKRRRESGFGEFDGSSRRGGTRSSTERFPRRGENAGDTAERFPRRRENAGDTAERFPRRRENAGDTTERFPRRRGNAGDTTERFPRRRGNAGDTTERFPRRGGYAGDNVSSRRESGFDDFNGSSRRRGARDSVERFPGRGRENGGGNVSSRRKGMDLNERYSGGSRGKGTFGGEVEGRREKKRGVRDSGSHFEMDRDGGRGIRRGEKGERRGSLVMSEEDDVDEEEDEDEVDKGYRSFKELIGSDEGSEEVDDDEDEDEDEEEDDEQGGDVFNRESVLAQRVSEDAGRGSSPDSPGSSHSYLSETRFDQFSISSLSMKGLKDAGYEKMTVVQEATLPVILKGKDVMAKARTGTGKTVAFLLPSIEGVVKAPPASHDQKRPPILVLVVCPTRELACQAAQEANKLLKYHTSIGVQVVIGGTRLALEQKRMQANPCQILVATPGRLRDHIENTAGFATRLMGVKVLVLDEADHLLDMGFRKDIEKIIAAVPKQRQTLLFSATIPQEVRQICHIALKRDHEYINTVQEGTEETHAQVRQMHLVAPLDNHFPVLCSLLKEHIADNVDYKVLVFCTTAMVTRLVAELLGELNLNVREIHSRKSQSYRTKVSDEFRKSKGLILVTSDVSARGVDYPDVTLVIQIGLPADRQQYIHRLGRTGRKGKEGQGMLLLAPWEEFFLSTIKDLPVSKAPAPLVDPDTRKKVERALSLVGMKDKESAYQAWLGYYNSNKTIGRDKYRLVELANEFSRTMGLDNPPAISKLVLGKMGLRNIPGLRSK